MNSSKITQRSALDYAISHLTDAPVEVIEKLKSVSASLEKKASAVRKPTPTQRENAIFKAEILAWMEPDTLYSISDVVKGVPAFANTQVSNARVSSMLTHLKNEGALERVEVKGKVYFKLA